MRIFIRLTIFVVILLGLALLIILVPLPEPFPAAMSSERNFLAAFLTGLLGMFMLISLAVSLVVSIKHGGSLLDQPLEKMGLHKTRYMLLGKRYSGIIDEEKVEITYFTPFQRQKGKLEIRIEESFPAEIVFTETRPRIYCRNCEPIDIETPVDDLKVFAESPALAERFLKNENFASYLKRTFSEGLRGIEIYFFKEGLYLRTRIRMLSGAQLSLLLEDVILLVKAASTVFSG